MADSAVDNELIQRLNIPPEKRSPQDVSFIYSRLRCIEALRKFREPQLRDLSRIALHQSCQPDYILYRRGDLCTSWFVILDGVIFIDGNLFLPGHIFGTRVPTSPYRTNDCLIVEPTSLIVIEYGESDAGNKPQPVLAVQPPRNLHPNDANKTKRNNLTRKSSSGGRFPADESAISRHVLNVQIRTSNGEREQYDQSASSLSGLSVSPSIDNRSSHASDDTSSAYSGSDMMSTDPNDQRRASLADSDDEDFDSASQETQSLKDGSWDCLLKDPRDRTDDDIDMIMESVRNLPAFSNLATFTCRELCRSMVIAMVREAQQIVMSDGEQLDTWSVVLNGVVEVRTPDGTIRELTRGDSFGVRATADKQYHRGVMRSVTDECHFACVTHEDYLRIIQRDETFRENIEEGGRTVLVYEKQMLEDGDKPVFVVNKGTPYKLVWHLVEDTTSVDPMYVEDLLLTWRTFLDSPQPIIDCLLQSYPNQQYRARVKRCLLLWVNNHMNDFEASRDMMLFLERFDQLMNQNTTPGERRLFYLACSTKARTRRLQLDISHLPIVKASSDSSYDGPCKKLPFDLNGGKEGCGIFVTHVEPESEADIVGLRLGDQILRINDRNCDRLTLHQVIDILNKANKVDMLVIYNPLNFHDMEEILGKKSINNAAPTERSKGFVLRGRSTGSITVSGPDAPPPPPPTQPTLRPHTAAHSGSGNNNSRCRSAHNSPSRVRKPRKNSSTSQSSNNNQSTSGSSSSYHRSNSQPDLSAMAEKDKRSLFQNYEDNGSDQVIRVWRSSDSGNTQSYRLIQVSKSTTAKDVVLQAMREFNIPDESWQNYSLCEVTVESGPLVKQRRLQDTLDDLPSRCALNCRFYLKNNSQHETLVSDDVASEIHKDSKVTLLQLTPQEIATRITLDDYEVFRSINASEYVAEVFNKSDSSETEVLGSNPEYQNLDIFTSLVNTETYWAPTEICVETNLAKRLRILKHFIKIAKLCKDLKNFNTLFCILSGLSLGPVDRLKQTWEKLPSKYVKLHSDLVTVLDCSRNFFRYRSLISPDHCQPPMIPFLPIVKKDLTFINLGNPTMCDDGLVNFQKLRMLAREVRSVCRMCNMAYDLMSTSSTGSAHQTPLLISHNRLTNPQNDAQGSVSSGGSSNNLSSGLALTLKRNPKRRSGLTNLKKVWEECWSTLRVRAYLKSLNIIQDSEHLSILSNCIEQSSSGGILTVNSGSSAGKKLANTSVAPSTTTSAPASTSNSNNIVATPIISANQPKLNFNTKSTNDSHKLMALSEGSKRSTNKNIFIPPGPAPSVSSSTDNFLAMKSCSGGRSSLPIGHSRPKVEEPSMQDHTSSQAVYDQKQRRPRNTSSPNYQNNSHSAAVPPLSGPTKPTQPPPYHLAVAMSSQSRQSPGLPNQVVSAVSPPKSSVKPPAYPQATVIAHSSTPPPPQSRKARPPPPAYHEVMQQHQRSPIPTQKASSKSTPPSPSGTKCAPTPPPRTVTMPEHRQHHSSLSPSTLPPASR